MNEKILTPEQEAKIKAIHEAWIYEISQIYESKREHVPGRLDNGQCEPYASIERKYRGEIRKIINGE